MSGRASIQNQACCVSSIAPFASWAMLIAFFLAGVCSLGSEALGPDPERKPGIPPTIVEHDIAPWDGAAFSLWIPAEQFGGKPYSWIYLRIWKSPEESAQEKFVFPDESMKIGRVMYFMDLQSPRSINWKNQPREELKGWVRFSQSKSDQPVLGEFDFVSEKRISLKGKFEAQWVSEGWLKGKSD
ncbi:MAG: hypothetical protein ACK553_00290 [Planctomycetota bacterium]|jgi:hypothetical protein